MTKISRESQQGVSNLTVIGKTEKEQGKIVSIKKPGEKPLLLLPPVQEKYIKAKKHDFL
jgi:hypothetical protein